MALIILSGRWVKMSEKELIQKVNEYTLYLSDDYLDEVCGELLKVDDLNLFFEKCYQAVDDFDDKSPCPFICDSVTHSHQNRQLIIQKYEKDAIYKFCEKMLYDSSYIKRREALIIICDLYIHRSTCKDILIKYFDYVIQKDPLLLYDYIMEFTWLYANDHSLKKNLYSKILKMNMGFSNLVLLEALDSSSEVLFSCGGLKKYKILSRLSKNKSEPVRLIAKNIRHNMLCASPQKRIETKAYILMNARQEFSNKLSKAKTVTYKPDDFKKFYLDYINLSWSAK